MARRQLEFSSARSASEEEEEAHNEKEKEKEADDEDDTGEAEPDADHNRKKSKKLKMNHGEGGGGGGGEGFAEKKPPPPFTRIFKEKDEIVLLKGMGKFHTASDFASFFKYVKKKCSVDVSEAQLKEKCRRLKEKYSKNIKKGKDENNFSDHDLKLFKLSKKLWGDLVSAGNTTVLKKPVEDKKGDAREEFSKLYPFLSLSFKDDDLSTSMMKSRLVLMDKSILDELDNEWKKQLLDEAQVKLGRVDLLQKQVRLVAKAS